MTLARLIGGAVRHEGANRACAYGTPEAPNRALYAYARVHDVSIRGVLDRAHVCAPKTRGYLRICVPQLCVDAHVLTFC